MAGYDVQPAILDRVASVLAGASDRIEGIGTAPAAPEAGACTATVAAALALLTDSMAAASESMHSTSGAVNDSRVRYEADDSAAGSSFTTVV